MNWIIAEDMAKAHLDALRRAAGDDRRAREARQGRARPSVRRALGTPLVRAGLALAAGLRAAKSAPEIVGAAACGEPLAGGSR